MQFFENYRSFTIQRIRVKVFKLDFDLHLEFVPTETFVSKYDSAYFKKKNYRFCKSNNI